MNIDNQIVLDCAFRYALGRMTYVTEAVSNIIIDCWDAIPLSRKLMYVEEIKEAIKKENIGMECDKIAWKRIIVLHEATHKTKGVKK